MRGCVGGGRFVRSCLLENGGSPYCGHIATYVLKGFQIRAQDSSVVSEHLSYAQATALPHGALAGGAMAGLFVGPS